MAIIPLLRVITFTLITLLSLVVFGICAHIVYLITGYSDSLNFTPFGLGAACVTAISQPLVFVLGRRLHRIFSTTILFEIIWFLILWVLWAATAGDIFAAMAYHFPGGCDYYNYAAVNQVCHEFTVVEVFSLVNFLCAFIYYDALFVYAFISGMRGRSVWAISVEEATSDAPSTSSLAAPATPYGVCPAGVPPPYKAYTQQIAPPAPTAQPCNVYPQQVPSTPPYGAYQQPVTHGLPAVHLGQRKHTSSPGPIVPQQEVDVNYAGYTPSPTTKDAPLPPHPNYAAYPAQLPLPSGYQEEPQPVPPAHQKPPSPYGSGPYSYPGPPIVL